MLISVTAEARDPHYLTATVNILLLWSLANCITAAPPFLCLLLAAWQDEYWIDRICESGYGSLCACGGSGGPNSSQPLILGCFHQRI